MDTERNRSTHSKPPGGASPARGHITEDLIRSSAQQAELRSGGPSPSERFLRRSEWSGQGHSAGSGSASELTAAAAPQMAEADADLTLFGLSSATAHLVGISGAGMKALAELLTGGGWRVTGSDLLVTGPQSRRYVRVHQGHRSDAVTDDQQIVVYSSAIAADNPELIEAHRRGLPCVSYTQMLGALMQRQAGVSVAGTHGKSTTTALAASILLADGMDPSVIVGAEFCRWGFNGRFGRGEWLLAESCEYRRNFLQLKPRHLALLPIEADHFDCYPELKDAREAYERLVAGVPADGTIVADVSNPITSEIASAAAANVIRVSGDASDDWCYAEVQSTGYGTRFQIVHCGQPYCYVRLPVPGEHNVRNAVVAAALAHTCGATRHAIRKGLSQFPGLRRRFEVVEHWRGLTLVDDYAHHPTAVQATLHAVRQRFPGRRVWCAFQPHQVLRTQRLLDEFAASLALADEVVLFPAYAARESADGAGAEVSQVLAERVAQAGKPVRYHESLDHLAPTLDDDAREGDVVITMGAGDIGRVHHEFA